MKKIKRLMKRYLAWFLGQMGIQMYKRKMVDFDNRGLYYSNNLVYLALTAMVCELSDVDCKKAFNDEGVELLVEEL